MIEVGIHNLPVGKCQRCGKKAELFEEWAERDDDPESGKYLKVCWDCSFTIINNRGDPFDSSEDEDDDLGELW
jgi:hypothetical protein